MTGPIRDGFVCVDKHAGSTSFEVVRAIRKRSGIRKTGHTGTLDKFARGLLIVLTGQCTKFTPLFLPLDKAYTAIFHFGIETETLDPEGAVVRNAGLPSLGDIEQAIVQFHGVICQVPPLYSAVHYQGKRAHELAREGKVVDLQPREVRIDSIRIIDYAPPLLTVDVVCSGGTYIRSLARDVGEASGSCAYVEDLIRTRIGRFTREMGVATDRFDPDRHVLPAVDLLELIDGMDIRTVKGEALGRIRNGGMITDDDFVDVPTGYGMIALIYERTVIGIVDRKVTGYRYFMVMNRDSL